MQTIAFPCQLFEARYVLFWISEGVYGGWVEGWRCLLNKGESYQDESGEGWVLTLGQCLIAASKVLTVMVETLAPSGYMRYSPDG